MNRPSPVDIEPVLKRIADARRIIVTTHARADGDAIGCVAAMQRLLRAQGKTAAAYLHEPLPPRYAFTSAWESAAVWPDGSAERLLGDADLLVVLDTCAAMQLGGVTDAIRRSSSPSLAVDHHVTRDAVVDEAWVDESAAACALMIARLAERGGWALDEAAATLLFMGLATDTGWFRFSNADREAFDAASRLIAAGARPSELYERLYLSEIEPRARLVGEVLRSVELAAGGRVAIIRLTGAMLARCGATRDMTEDLINEPQRLGSVNVCVMIVEPAGDEPVRVSLRSKRGIDVAALAAQWGGGGHARAAGAKITGTFEAVAADVTKTVLQAVEAAG